MQIYEKEDGIAAVGAELLELLDFLGAPKGEGGRNRGRKTIQWFFI